MNTQIRLSTDHLGRKNLFSNWQTCLQNHLMTIESHRTSDTEFSAEMILSRINGINFTHVSGKGAHRYYRQIKHITPPGEADYVHIAVNFDGKWLITQDGRTADVAPGQLVIFDSSRPFESSHNERFHHTLLEIPRSLWIKKGLPTELLTAQPIDHTTPFGSLLSDYVLGAHRSAPQASPETVARLAITAVDLVSIAFNEIGFETPDSSKYSMPVLLFKAKALIETDFHNPDLSAEVIAKELGVSARYIQRLFKQESNTVARYLWDVRLTNARRQLNDVHRTSISITQIAYDCGFSSFSHFCNRFKEKYGLTPSQYRLMAKSIVN